MIRIAITQAAFDAIAASCRLGRSLTRTRSKRAVSATFGWRRGGARRLAQNLPRADFSKPMTSPPRAQRGLKGVGKTFGSKWGRMEF